jgi:predicted outer membrane repeat protein
VYGSATSFTNVTFSANSAGNLGGAVFEPADAVFTNVTFVGNRATNNGGAIYNSMGSPAVSRSILFGNTPDQVMEEPADPHATITDSIVQGGCPANVTCTGLSTADPLLGPLADNGGPTRTRALGATSPAIDAAAVCGGITSDQRGVARPVDGNKDGTKKCDYGAFEYVPPAPTVGFGSAKSSGSESVTAVSIPVKLSTTATGPVTVKYKITNGTAKSPSDYAAGTGTLTLPALSTTKDLTFAVINDRFDERNETVVITLSAPTGAALARATHTYTIIDDDPRVACRGRLATIIGTAGNDILTGTNGSDVIAGLGGNDTIDGAGGDDIICGNAGDDTLKGGKGNDVLVAAGGNDRLEGGDGADQAFGGRGKDKLSGGPGPGDYCDGGPGAGDVLLPAHGCESTSGIP